MSNSVSILMPLILGVIAAVIVYATVTGRQIPLVSTPRAALIALLVVGMAMCAPGIGQVAASGKWTSPLAIVGMLLGVLIFAIFIAALAGWKLPLVASETQAVVAIAVVMAVKTLIGIPSLLLRLL